MPEAAVAEMKAARPRAPRRRLDVWLAESGQAESREKAQALIMAGRVLVNGRQAPKPGTPVRGDDLVQVLAGPGHVGRGALKLEGALAAFGIDPRGRTCVDVGASTGGFTEVLLRHGASRVYAVDTGRGQIHESLRADPRVVLREQTNARRLSPAEVPEPCALAVMDVSFISSRLILPALASVLAPGADVVVLVKPQFEVGRAEVGRGGLVKHVNLHARSVLEVARAAQAGAYGVLAGAPSPITGGEGNREFFLHLREGGSRLAEDALAALAGRMVAAP